MSMPEADETEISGAARAILMEYDKVIGERQARNIAYVALVGARGAKIREADMRRASSLDKRG